MARLSNSLYSKRMLANVKQSYNLIARHFHQTRKVLRWGELENCARDIHDGDSVLDVGCGNGRFLNFLRNKKIKYLGIDQCPELIKEAKKQYGNYFRNGSILDRKIKLKKYDHILCFATLHHIPTSKLRLRAVKNLYRYTRRGGRVCVTVWNLKQKRFFWKNIFQKIRWFLRITDLHFHDIYIAYQADEIMVLRYHHIFSLRELKRLFKKAGFQNITAYYSRSGQQTSRRLAFNIYLEAYKL